MYTKFNKKVLIADDEYSIRESLGELITKLYGYEYELAEDGDIALQIIEENPDRFGIILTDLKMPNMDGLELISRSKDINDNIIFIIITGYATKDNAISALKHGAYDFVHKPFNIEQMKAVLSRAVEHWILKEENIKYQSSLENLVEQRTKELKTLNEELRALLHLNEEINKMKNFGERITRYHENLVRRFNPDTVVLILYNNYSKSFNAPRIHSSNNSDIFLPEDTNLLSGGNKRYFSISNDSNDYPEEVHLNKEDEEFCCLSLEHEVFLGYLYMGNKSGTELADNENCINLYTSNLESLLYNNYLIKKHQREKEKMFLSGIKVIADTVEANSPFTRKHSDRVEKVARMIAEKLSFSYDKKYRLRIACILHDIGKVGVDNRIVYKPGKLTVEEREIIKSHSELGANIVKNLYGYKIDHIVRHHHERWDGKGYPDGLIEEEIPLESRIIALADAFDSMITTRPYRRRLPIPEVINEIKINAGTQFDPHLSVVFLECIKENISTFQLMKLSE